MASKTTPRETAIGCVVLVVIGFLVWAGCSVFGGSGGGSGGKKTTYTATSPDHVVINPADLAVTVRVTNTGKTAGTPQCTIDASDPSGTYTGVDVATLKGKVAAGATTTFVDNLTITKQGAQYITDVKVTCS
jgi:hypothetical protein